MRNLKRYIAVIAAVYTLAILPAVSQAGNSFLASLTKGVPVVSRQCRTYSQNVITGVNASRTAHHVRTLTENTDLNQAALVRVVEMIHARSVSHTRPDGSSYSTVCQGVALGENLTRFSGYPGMPDDVALHLWRKSEPHYANMLRPYYTQTGVAFAYAGNGVWYACELFALPGWVRYVDMPQA